MRTDALPVISRRGLVTKFAVVEGDDAEPDVKALQGYPEDE